MKRPDPPHHWLHAQLDAWQAEGLVTNEAARTLRERYPLEPATPPSAVYSMTVILGLFGSFLISGGIILLFAHNWHDLPRMLRTVLALSPLLVFQVLGLSVLQRRTDSKAWREGVGAGLTLSIGAAIALIAQTYQLGGDFGRFMLTWTVLTLPVIYLLRAGSAFWLYLAGAVIYAGHTQAYSQAAPVFFLLLAAAIPFAVWTHSQSYHRTLALLCRYALALALWAGLPLSLDYRFEGAWLPLLTFAAGGMLLWDRPRDGRIRHRFRHPFAVTAGLYLTATIAVFSFADVWQEYGRSAHDDITIRPFMIALGGLAALVWATGFERRAKGRDLWTLLIASVFPLIALIGWGTAGTDNGALALMLATNATGLVIGLAAIAKALHDDRLSLLNYGLLLVGGLVVLRFFDADLGFAVRGLAFIALGLAFLLANFLFVRHRRRSVNPNTPNGADA